MNALDQKAAEIARHVEAGDRARVDAIEHYQQAGQLLIEVRAENKRGFEAFLDKKLASVGRSRAYEFMQVAGGRKTVEEVKEATRKRVEKHRKKKKSVTSATVTDAAQEEPEISESITAAELRAAFLVRVTQARECAQWALKASNNYPNLLQKRKELCHFVREAESISAIWTKLAQRIEEPLKRPQRSRQNREAA